MVVYSDHWTHVYSFGRVHSPILILATAAAGRPSWPVIAPFALMLPRTLIQLAPQLLGILHGVAGVTP